MALVKNSRPRYFGWVVGLPLIVLGETLRLWALTYIGPTTRTRTICADRLVKGGPYSLTRNPLYLANFLKVLGILFIGGNRPLGGFILAFYSIEFASLIAYEEGFLAEKFPEAHRDYVARVPAFFPDGRYEGFDETPVYSISEAVASEKRTFSSTGIILAILGMKTLWANLPFRGEQLPA